NKLKYKPLLNSSHSAASYSASNLMIQKEIYRGLRILNIVAPPPNLSLSNLTKFLVDSLKPQPILRLQRRIGDIIINPASAQENYLQSYQIFVDSDEDEEISSSLIDKQSTDSAISLLKKA
ncbi:hypothetical protein M9Y10_032352, partial [Tritrichomonas musculus]